MTLDLRQLQSRSRRARGQAQREKLQLLARCWQKARAEAEDKVWQKATSALEMLNQSTLAAADQGKPQVTLIRLGTMAQDLRHLLQQELHQSLGRVPDPYPTLRSQGPPSFRELENWLRQDLGVNNWEHQCPLPWLVKLESWSRRRAQASWWGRLWLGSPKLPGPLLNVYRECQRRKLRPRFEPFQHREEQGLALVVDWR